MWCVRSQKQGSKTDGVWHIISFILFGGCKPTNVALCPCGHGCFSLSLRFISLRLCSFTIVRKEQVLRTEQ